MKKPCHAGLFFVQNSAILIISQLSAKLLVKFNEINSDEISQIMVIAESVVIYGL